MGSTLDEFIYTFPSTEEHWAKVYLSIKPEFYIKTIIKLQEFIDYLDKEYSIENNDITDYEQTYEGFDTYEEAYELFVRLQCSKWDLFFFQEHGIYQLLLQLEECEETDEEITCIDVKNEWWIINPNFKEEN